ncbi:hypothetical protein FRC04_005895 [Tulasnella sp. 424]|nr:hypothetical protein FRC04_005895 [Tulasnella sp. 424]
MPATRTSRPTLQNARSSSSSIKGSPHPGTSSPILRGYLESLSDALIVVEAAMRGLVGRLVAKPSELQKESYAQSGNILVFEESEVGIKRWTDPLTWSETRASPPYFIYRETTSEDQSVSTSRSLKLANRSPTRSKGVSFDLQRLLGAMSSGKKCRNQGHVLEHGMCKRTITVELPGRKWHVVSYYYLEDILSGELKRPSNMAPLGYLIHEISEELLDPRLYYRKGRNCLLQTKRTEDGRLVYAGETDETPSKRARRLSSSELEDEGVQEFASPPSPSDLSAPDAPYATVFHQPQPSWNEGLSQTPLLSDETPTSAAPVHASSPQVSFNIVQYQPASPSSFSVTTTLASFSGQGWEFDDLSPLQADPTSEPWTVQPTSSVPSRCSSFSSLTKMGIAEASTSMSAAAWPSGYNPNMFWSEPPSFDTAQFGSPSHHTGYQLRIGGEVDGASARSGQVAPLADAEPRAVAGIYQSLQPADVWWNGAENVTYGDYWTQTMRNR